MVAMKVSVIIPAYNEQEYIGRCLASLQRQDVPADEIIVVDNNCTDATADIAACFEVLVVREYKQGLIEARNKGFQVATSDILARCDADTIVRTDWIKRIKKTFTNKHIEALSGPCYFYDAPFLNGNSTWNHWVYFRVAKLITGYNVLFGSNMAIRRQTWLEIKHEMCINDSVVHEDLDLGLHIQRHRSIKYDRSLTAGISARRMLHQPFSFFIEYPTRWVRTLYTHRHLLRK